MPPRSFLTASIVTSISCLIDKFYIITLYMLILYHIFMNSIILYHTIYTLHIHYIHITYTLHTYYIYITYTYILNYIIYIILTNDSNYCYHSFKLGQRVQVHRLEVIKSVIYPQRNYVVTFYQPTAYCSAICILSYYSHYYSIQHLYLVLSSFNQYSHTVFVSI